MPEIQRIGVGTVGVPRIAAREIIPPPVLPAEPPITLMLGFPVADMPGGEMPHYEPLNFTPSKHSHKAAPAPKTDAEEKPAESKQPDKVSKPPRSPLDISKIATELPCPPPDAIPLGAKNKSQTAVIIGYKRTVEGKCEAIYEPLGIPTIISNYLPGTPVVVTTATIAAVATTSAIFAKPLGDFLLKAVKPTVKKVIKKIKAKMGKQTPVESVAQRRKNQRALRK
jgi:hypothetical protein|tara:strand:- start:2696 stop:3370 length:675 start_codon:yes stop_codon:yes gene_type:complete